MGGIVIDLYFDKNLVFVRCIILEVCGIRLEANAAASHHGWRDCRRVAVVHSKMEHDAAVYLHDVSCAPALLCRPVMLVGELRCALAALRDDLAAFVHGARAQQLDTG